jgi:hypothetical protein
MPKVFQLVKYPTILDWNHWFYAPYKISLLLILNSFHEFHEFVKVFAKFITRKIQFERWKLFYSKVVQNFMKSFNKSKLIFLSKQLILKNDSLFFWLKFLNQIRIVFVHKKNYQRIGQELRIYSHWLHLFEINLIRMIPYFSIYFGKSDINNIHNPYKHLS